MNSLSDMYNGLYEVAREPVWSPEELRGRVGTPEDQERLERSMMILGIRRYLNNLETMTTDRVGSLGVTKYFIDNTLGNCLEEYDNYYLPLKGTRNNKLYQLLMSLPKEIMVRRAFECLVKYALDDGKYSTCLSQLVTNWQSTTRQAYYAKVRGKGLADNFERRLNEKGVHGYKRQLEYKRNMEIEDIPDIELPERMLQINMASKLCDLVIKYSGIFKIVTTYKGRGKLKKRSNIVKFTDEAKEKVSAFDKYYIYNNALLRPYVYPPVPWTSIDNGGGHTGYIRTPFVKYKSNGKVRRRYREHLRSLDLTEEFKALNKLQSRAFKVNKQVYEVMSTLWEGDKDMVNMPSKYDIPTPETPWAKEDHYKYKESKCEEYLEWVNRFKLITEKNQINTSKRLALDSTLAIAKEYLEVPRFYYQWSNDVRGRKYTCNGYLSPQGTEYAKALLLFTDGLPVMSESDLYGLYIQGANTWGMDKEKKEDRIEWVQENGDMIASIAANPYEDKRWHDADEPWLFLAFCFDYAGFLKEGWGYVTHLPCNIDGSCNGIQHLSALMLDASSAKSVNLLNSDDGKPNSIYIDVANIAIKKLQQDIGSMEKITWKEHDEEKECRVSDVAVALLKLGIDKSITKRPVMVVPYSGTLYACMGYIKESVMEKMEEQSDKEYQYKEMYNRDFFPCSAGKACTYLSKIVWDSILETIKAAKDVMKFLQDCGVACADEGKLMTWYTPTGFYVEQPYIDVDKKQLSFKDMEGKRVQLQMLADSALPRKSRVRSATSPNFIHSMDAAHMTKVINNFKSDDLFMIHDSYGCLSPNLLELEARTRQEFVGIYRDNWLEKLKKHLADNLGVDVDLEVPYACEFDIEEVLNSTNMFG